MERKIVLKAIRKCKKNANLDYAYSKAPDDCTSCSNAFLANTYGVNSKGIWVKFFTFGMNREVWNKDAQQYIAHDLTDEQSKIVVETLKKYFDVEWDGSKETCIKIRDKKQEKRGVA